MSFTTPRTSIFKRHKSFSVEVLHFEDKGLDKYSRCENKWFVYAYIFENHPRHAFIDVESSEWQSAIAELPFHAGCSFARLDTLNHCGSNKTSQVYKIGADYNHYGDHYFLGCGVEFMNSDAFEVIADANLLFERLENEYNESVKEVA